MSRLDGRLASRFRRRDWIGARALLRSELRKTPGHHWLLTRLSSTYYAQSQYRRALGYSRQALHAVPRCPLVLWDYASALDMLNRKRAAANVYRGLIRRGVRRIANGECGEGLARARGLVSDSLYRLGGCYADLGQPVQASKAYRRALRMRGPGCQSIYSIADLRRTLAKVRNVA
jgi:tetratricopeptide (TPR) repeat protein